jgi:hypothetical protein
MLKRLSRNPTPLVIALVVAAIPHLASAGPPFVTDDPEPTELHHWENYAFASGVHGGGATAGEAGIDLNYGAARDLQLTTVIPLGWQAGQGGATGPADLEIAAKYRLLHQDEHGLTPDVAIFPRITLPTGDRRFGAGRATLQLPVWLQRDYGKWSFFGGGGYHINPGGDHQNFWTSGIAVLRQLGERLQLGGEVYHQTASERDGKPFTGVNLGAIYKVTDHWSLLASGGPGVQNREQGGFDFYVSLEATY